MSLPIKETSLCPERLSFVLIDGSFNYPSTKISTRFLYYLSVYGNLSKNSLFCLPQPGFLGESGCKGTTNFDTIQILKKKKSREAKTFRELLHFKGIPYIIYLTQRALRSRYRYSRVLRRRRNRGRSRQADRRWHPRCNPTADRHKPSACRGRR